MVLFLFHYCASPFAVHVFEAFLKMQMDFVRFFGSLFSDVISMIFSVGLWFRVCSWVLLETYSRVVGGK
jgi:hypothetical protein